MPEMAPGLVGQRPVTETSVSEGPPQIIPQKSAEVERASADHVRWRERVLPSQLHWINKAIHAPWGVAPFSRPVGVSFSETISSFRSECLFAAHSDLGLYSLASSCLPSGHGRFPKLACFCLSAVNPAWRRCARNFAARSN